MKFSEYVALGSTFMTFDHHVFIEGNCGCLVGMATAAKTGITHWDEGIFHEAFPWIWQPRVVECPRCHSVGTSYGFSLSCVAAHIALGQMTFEDAMDYIHMVEPLESERSTTAWGLYPPRKKVRPACQI